MYRKVKSSPGAVNWGPSGESDEKASPAKDKYDQSRVFNRATRAFRKFKTGKYKDTQHVQIQRHPAHDVHPHIRKLKRYIYIL